MREHPILFNKEMVRSILAGRKTQTRRVIRPQPDEEKFSGMIDDRQFARFWTPGEYTHTSTVTDVRCPYGVPGDRLWVREAWQTTRFFVRSDGTSPIAYLATDADPTTGLGPYDRNWKPSIHMPRWASRITLEVVGVRVERVQEISSHDALREGIDPVYVDKIRNLWDSIYAKRGYGWDTNPWVWVVEFELA